MPASRRSPAEILGTNWPCGLPAVGVDDPEQLAAQRLARIVARIRAARLRRGWSQAELARRTGLRPHTVGRIESGSAWPDFLPLSAALDALDLDLDVADRSAAAEVAASADERVDVPEAFARIDAELMTLRNALTSRVATPRAPGPDQCRNGPGLAADIARDDLPHERTQPLEATVLDPEAETARTELVVLAVIVTGSSRQLRDFRAHAAAAGVYRSLWDQQLLEFDPGPSTIESTPGAHALVWWTRPADLVWREPPAFDGCEEDLGPDQIDCVQEWIDAWPGLTWHVFALAEGSAPYCAYLADEGSCVLQTVPAIVMLDADDRARLVLTPDPARRRWRQRAVPSEQLGPAQAFAADTAAELNAMWTLRVEADGRSKFDEAVGDDEVD